MKYWIPVEQEKQPDDVRCIVYYANTSKDIRIIVGRDLAVTHWFLLPPLPDTTLYDEYVEMCKTLESKD